MMGCCDCGGQTKAKRRVPLALWVVVILAGLALLYWQ